MVRTDIGKLIDLNPEKGLSKDKLTPEYGIGKLEQKMATDRHGAVHCYWNYVKVRVAVLQRIYLLTKACARAVLQHPKNLGSLAPKATARMAIPNLVHPR